MEKKKFTNSFVLSILTHLLIFSLLGVLVIFASKEGIFLENKGGKEFVWVDITAENSESSDDRAFTRTQEKPFQKTGTKGKEKSEIPPDSSLKNDAMLLRQKNNLTSQKEASSSSATEAYSEVLEKLGSDSGPGANSSNRSIGTSPSILALIRKKIEQSKKYPALAKARKIEGVASLSFVIQASGNIEALQVMKSSGSEILDEEALATVRRAVPLPYYALPIRISIKFSLE